MSTKTALSVGFWATTFMVALGAQVAAAAAGGPGGPESATVITVDVDPAGRLETQPPSFDSMDVPAARRRILVKYRPGQGPPSHPEAASERAFAHDPDLFVLTLPPGRSVARAVRDFRSRPQVLYAEPDYLATVEAIPNDPRWPEQWSLPLIGAPEVWDTQTDAGDVVVAVIDTGVDFTHPDVVDNLWTDPATGAHGFTFADGVTTPDGSDVYGHGTHVAGIIGAAADNAVGIAGINWSVQILSLAFLGEYGTGSVSDAILAFDKIVELRQAGFNIRLSNNSWGTGGYSQALEEAVERARAAGVLHVCAAGNYVGDVDTNPRYPAAFDGPGILSVNASTSTDGHASFSGYGLARVDLAAPGADILSTVPTGTCSLCDPSGYRLASGTSMAAPHVAGVLAAAFHLNPALQPEEARNVQLDPASFVALPASSLASRNTTGGRLDFAATLANPGLYSPPPNAFPTASTTPAVTRSAGNDVTLSMVVADADGDSLREQWGRRKTGWLLGDVLNQHFPAGPSSNPVSFLAPALARAVSAEYVGSVADGRGGSALVQSQVTVIPVPTPGLPPSGQLTVTPTEGPVGTSIELSFAGTDPEGGSLRWGYSGYGSGCCFDLTTTVSRTMTSAGVFRFNGEAVDPELQISPLTNVVVRIGGALGEPPMAEISVDATDGVVPLTVNWDATASYDPDGGSLTYTMFCDTSEGINVSQPGPPTGSCTYDFPGPHKMTLLVRDEDSYSHSRDVYIMVHLPIAPDTVPPVVGLTAPASGAVVNGLVTVSADASDDVGVSQVEFLLDGSVIGTDGAAPFSMSWDAGSAAPGSHTLEARAFDQAGNTAVSAPVFVTVDTVPPVVGLTAPTSGAFVNGLVTVSADATDDVGLDRVDFLLDGTVVLGTDTTAPYGIDWDPSGTASGSHTLEARAFDQAGNTTLSDSIPITVDTVAPTAVVTAPAPNTLVGGLVTVSASASDDLGVAQVDFLLDGTVVLGTDTTAPYSIDWDPSGTSTGSHTLVARAIDQAGNEAVSIPVAITVDVVPPVVALTAPAPGAWVTGIVTLGADATDDLDMDRVEFLLDGTVLLGTDSTAPYSITWDARGTTSGSHTLEARAFDEAGNGTLSDSVPITVDTERPAVVVTAPPEGASVGGIVTIVADATDNLGISHVEFLRDSTVLLGIDTTAPYSVDWDATDAELGNHTLHARAWDLAGNSTPSDPHWVTVIDVTPPAPPTGLTAAGGPLEIGLDWADGPEGDLGGYRVYRSTTEGSGYALIDGSVPDSSYLDSAVAAGTPYYYVVSAVDASGNESGWSGEATAVPHFVSLAVADVATPAGTVSGSYLATHAQDNSNQGLQEVLSGGKPSNRYSYLEHVWQLDVLAGEGYAFHVDARRTSSPDGDEFLLEYSRDGNSYSPMLTVTKVADDDSYQVFAFPEDVGGTLYVRATDTDRTAGSQALDTLTVDHMFVSTAPSTGPDVTPPNPPTGLAATPGDGFVSLDWDDSGAPDLAGYRVYRAATAGGPYTPLNGSLVAASAYTDNTVVNGTTYYYVVSAEDTSGNESGYSQEASTTPQAGGAFVHVDSIVLGTAGNRKVKGTATVTVVDQGSAPVSGATVTGTFSGDFSEVLSGSTDASGSVTLTTSGKANDPVSFSFCVDDVAHPSYTYDPGSNLETCDQLN